MMRTINNKQFIDQAVKKAGRHMEYSMIVAYIARCRSADCYLRMLTWQRASFGGREPFVLFDHR
jgi:hypothetical protein